MWLCFLFTHSLSLNCFHGLSGSHVKGLHPIEQRKPKSRRKDKVPGLVGLHYQRFQLLSDLQISKCFLISLWVRSLIGQSYVCWVLFILEIMKDPFLNLWTSRIQGHRYVLTHGPFFHLQSISKWIHLQSTEASSLLTFFLIFTSLLTICLLWRTVGIILDLHR